MAKVTCEVTDYGTEIWRCDEKVHRIYKSGTQEWLIGDKLHREDGPAFIDMKGNQFWYRNGHFHREDGPAIIDSDGTQEWWLSNKKYSFNDWCKKANKSDEEKAILKLEYL